ncbi:unnamed protein product [Soboliphyme baturini]|uniref:Uncharacterized protein n=1 Tax=Soboliphyme baturini TaxID=241478 RepID=A0A183J4R4_9BILA|nr:unnamed protein product [Soboliphyme baturini]
MRNNGFLACGETVAEAFHLAYLVIVSCEIQVMLLQGIGFVVGGESVEEAFILAFNLMQACEYQVLYVCSSKTMGRRETTLLPPSSMRHRCFRCNGVVVSWLPSRRVHGGLLTWCAWRMHENDVVRAARAGIENLIVPSEEARRKAFESAHSGPTAEDRKMAAAGGRQQGRINWRTGELEWEAWMRVLDNAGFRTGHAYRQPSLRCKVPPPQSEVEEPPAASSYGMLDETDMSSSAMKASQMKRDQERLRWINSPTVYQKQELQETGTTEPKTYTKVGAFMFVFS